MSPGTPLGADGSGRRGPGRERVAFVTSPTSFCGPGSTVSAGPAPPCRGSALSASAGGAARSVALGVS